MECKFTFDFNDEKVKAILDKAVDASLDGYREYLKKEDIKIKLIKSYKMFCYGNISYDCRYYRTIQHKHKKSFWKKLAQHLKNKKEHIDEINCC